jgi:predicted pyridoxine 5'-phosphate oxidase superfamily flavin-nucleotide-binding protein
MSRLYGPLHRSLQDRFDTRRLADNTEARVVLTEIPPEHKAFIESRDMFFLSTIDHQGRPTVSYKGGDPGFVRVLDNKTVAFPCYDGNGMFYSMGNLLGNQHVGMLLSISRSRIGCGYRALLASATTIHCCRNMPRRN